ncbi:MAG: hydroxyproline-2-epimerase [Phycisphaera sp.]|nr:hydroxyproline-2-epimerase [Phycisphaera sp.]
MKHVEIIDSHTAGEPTRVIVSGGPDLGHGGMAARRERFAKECDGFRGGVILEPRGSDVMVGALLCDSPDPSCVAGVVFFNNVGALNMCGHGTIGVAATLAHMGRIKTGKHRLDTPVGVVPFELLDEHTVRLQNVPSYRHSHNVLVETSRGRLAGDIAWGGNWFFLVKSPIPLDTKHIPDLTALGLEVRRYLDDHHITGKDGGVIDHVEFYGPSPNKDADARNFVLCPGAAYDRSPCGTGTSAKVACLAADGHLQPGQTWVQESIIGSRFVADYQPGQAGVVHPTVTGSAYIYGQGQLLFDDKDPFRGGIRI